MRIVRLRAPFFVNRALLNAGEVVGLPDDVAERLVSDGQAIFVEPAPAAAKALDGPPVDKLMRPKTKKFFRHGSRHREGIA